MILREADQRTGLLHVTDLDNAAVVCPQMEAMRASQLLGERLEYSPYETDFLRCIEYQLPSDLS